MPPTFPGVGSNGGFDPTQPILPSLPDRAAQLTRKYSGNASDPLGLFQPAFNAASPAARAALLNLDLQKVGRGSDPYTATESALGLTAATENRQVTPEPDQGIFGDAISDISTFVRGIPHLPGAIIGDVLDIPDSLARVPDAIAEGNTPLQSIGNVANLPGFRLLPGSFILGAAGDDVYAGVGPNKQLIAGGGWDTLASHPVYTALDALPFASKAAKATSPYTRVAEAQLEQARILGTPPPRAPRPIPTFLRNLGGGVEDVADLRAGLLEHGQVPARGFGDLAPESAPVAGRIATPGPLGRVMDRSTAAFNRTAPGKYIADARSQLARAGAERALYHAGTIVDEQRAATLDPTVAPAYHALASELRDLSRDITPDRMAEINRAITHGDQAARAAFTPEEVAYLDKFTQGQEMLRAAQVQRGMDWYANRSRMGSKANADGLIEVEFPHGKEIYDAVTGARILDRRYRVQKVQWFQDQLAALQSSTPYSLSSLKSDARAVASDRHLSQAELRQATRIMLERAHQSGLDTTAALKALNKAQTTHAIQSILSNVSDARYTPRTRVVAPASTIDTVRSILAVTKGADPKAQTLYTLLSNRALSRTGGTRAARAALNDLLARSVHGRPSFSAASLREALDIIDSRTRFASKFEKIGVSAKDLRRATKKSRALEAASMPGRFDDLARATARDALQTHIRDLEAAGRLSPDIAAQAIDAAAGDWMSRVGELVPSLLNDGTIDRVLKDAQNSWLQLAAQGMDPQWVHRVTPSAARRTLAPRVFDSPVSVGQLKKRLWDPAPSIPDLTISLQHQAYEFLNQAASLNFAAEMASWYGVTGVEIQRMYRDLAIQAHNRNPSISEKGHLAQLIEADWTPYDPDSFLRGKGQAPRTRNAQDQLYVPRSVAATLDRLRPTLPSTAERALSAPMRVFRTSILPLSPRWHLNNIIGGAIMLSSIASPRTFSHIMEAYRLAKNGGEELSRIESHGGRAAMPPSQQLRDIHEWEVQRRINDPTGVATAHSVAAGSTIGRVLRQARDSRIARAAAGGFERVTQASYDFNGFIDNMNRSMAFLTGQDRGLARGLSRDEAVAMGIQTARDALQSWDRLTPVERAGMRMIFPFYSWTSHLLRYVSQFPHDHPWRVAIMSRVAETELADLQTGLPQRFASMFTPFGVDAFGNAVGVTLDSANPFRDVTNYGLLAGFMLGQEEGSVAALTSGFNPFISTVLEAAGFDTFRGSPDLYPDMVYDPTTGQLSSGGGGPLPLLALNNFLPQSEYLTSLAGMNREFTNLARNNPEAAARQLRGALGIPNVVRRFNVPEETIKAEVTRYNAMRDVQNEALRTGNLDLMNAYPVLSAYRAQIEQLGASGQLADQQTATSAEYGALSDAYQQQVAATQNRGGGVVSSLAGLLGF